MVQSCMKLIKLTEEVLNREHTSATTRRAHSPTHGNCDDNHNQIEISDTNTHSHNASGQESEKQRECKAECRFCACATNN